jgi:mRNA interferase RelE/StbE
VRYRVVILPVAQKDHHAIPSPWYESIEGRLLALSENPRPPGCKKLKDSDGDWRIRVGIYRVLYNIDDGRSTVTILRVRHRKDVYR